MLFLVAVAVSALLGLPRCARASSGGGERGLPWPRRSGSSLRWPLLPWSRAPGVPAQSPRLRGLWEPPEQVIRPLCPALAGRVLTTRPPGMPRTLSLNTSTLSAPVESTATLIPPLPQNPLKGRCRWGQTATNATLAVCRPPPGQHQARLPGRETHYLYFESLRSLLFCVLDRGICLPNINIFYYYLKPFILINYK